MNFGVVGLGVVGRHMAADIERARHSCVKYDTAVEYDTREAVNLCDAVFVCVGTPSKPDGSCDLSAIVDVFSWLRVPLAIIRSTVPPGTTHLLQFVMGQDTKVAFSPEFIGEGINAPYVAMRQPPFLIIGGSREARLDASIAFSKFYNSECEFVFLDSTTAEVAKYFENTFLATKVTLCNEFYDICRKFGADYDAMVNAVAHDYRIGRSHLHVYPDKRGFDGHCLPKDLSALLAVVDAPLTRAVMEINRSRHAG